MRFVSKEIKKPIYDNLGRKENYPRSRTHAQRCIFFYIQIVVGRYLGTKCLIAIYMAINLMDSSGRKLV